MHHNWSDSQVEMKIAQERYQSVIESKQIERALTGVQPIRSNSHSVRNWLGDLFINWGQQLQKRVNPVPEQSLSCC